MSQSSTEIVPSVSDTYSRVVDDGRVFVAGSSSLSPDSTLLGIVEFERPAFS